MTANAAARQAVLWETETNWGENTAVSGSATRLQTLNRIDTSGLELAKERIQNTMQYQHEEPLDVNTVYGGSFMIEVLATGHGGVTTGSLTETDLCTLLENVLGGKDVTGVGTTADGTGDKTAPGVNGGTFANGTLCRIGAFGDDGGEQQAYAVDNLNMGTLTLLNDMTGGPSNGDQVYAMQVVHPQETPGTAESITSSRWRILSANKQYECHGCFWDGRLNFVDWAWGSVPKLQIGIGVSWWKHVNTTFPDTTSTDAKDGAPLTRGSVFIQDRGTTTRATYSVRDFSINVAGNVQAIEGTGGVNANQIVEDAKRLQCQMTLNLTFDAEATGTQTWYDLYTSSSESFQHILMTLSIEDGAALALYLPRAKLIAPVPGQQDVDGLNRVQATFKATTDADTTSELTLSNWRLGMG